MAAFYLNVHQYYDKAESYFKNAMEIYKKELGEDHTVTAKVFLNFGVFLSKIKKDNAGSKFNKCAHTFFRNKLGKNHQMTKSAESWMKLINKF